MSTTDTTTSNAGAGREEAGGKDSLGVKAADWADGRLGLYRMGRSGLFNLRKVFPDHWSFMLGEVALYSFIIIILTGVYLTLFFTPSMGEVVYHGTYTPLNGIPMSEAYKSTVDISFDVRGGLLIRQIHHWAALVFVAAMMVHMFRVFFTGAFRKPREINWMFGFLLLVLGLVDGFLGYSLPDDLLSGTGVRFMEGAILSVPIVGSYIAMFLFGGAFPGTDMVPRFFTLHVLLIPGLMFGLLAVHLILVFYHKHTQWPGAGKSEKNVVGMPLMPIYMAKAGGFFFVVFGILSVVSAVATINPIWQLGPFKPNMVSTNAQPDWYMGFSEGLIRIMPGWEINFWGHTLVLGVFIPLMVFGLVLVSVAVYPFIEGWVTGDKREHHILDRPRNAPVRTGLGAAWISEFLLLMVGGGNDLWATHFDLSINTVTWICRIGFFVLPVLVFMITKRWCMALQRRDRDLVLHGRESGVIKRLPHGEFMEEHEPLSQAELYPLVQHDQQKPVELPPREDENGVRRKISPVTKLRARLTKFFFSSEVSQIEKPTAEEYKEITSGHGEH